MAAAAAAEEDEEVEDRAAAARGGRARAMIDAPKLRACPLSEIKLANRAGGRPVRTLLAAAAAGSVIRRTPTRCPIFFHATLPSLPLSRPHRLFSGESFWIPAIGASDTGTRGRRRRRAAGGRVEGREGGFS